MAALQEQLLEVEASTDNKKVYGAIAAVGFAVIAVLTALKLFYADQAIPTSTLVLIMVLLGIPTIAIGGVMPVLEVLTKNGLKRHASTNVHAMEKLQEAQRHELEKFEKQQAHALAMLRATQEHELKLAEAQALTAAGFEPASVVDDVQLYRRK